MAIAFDQTCRNLFGILLIFIYHVNNTQTLDFQYHSYHQMTNFLQTIVAQFPNQAALYEIGRSTQGIE